MRRLALLALAMTCSLGIAADQIPHLDLIRGLRTQGQADLALQYLEKVEALKLPELQNLLILERAKIFVEMAAEESDTGERNKLIARARASFDQFNQANPNSPQAVQVRLERARLLGLEGEGVASQARRADASEGKAGTKGNELRVASRKLFTDAAAEYKQIPKLIDAQLGKADPALKKELEAAQLQVQFDEGRAIYNMAKTFSRDSGTEYGKGIEAARKIFDTLGARETTIPICWIAKVWAARCEYENDRKKEASEGYAAVLKATEPSALAAIRLARAFQVDNLYTDALDAKSNKYLPIIVATDNWLRDYPNFRRSPEGLNVRYVAARARDLEARNGIIFDKQVKKDDELKPIGLTPDALAFAKRAEADYKALLETPNEYSDRAGRFRLQLILLRTTALNKSSDDIEPFRLVNFDECFLQAQVQEAKLGRFINTGTPTPEAISDEILSRYNKVIHLVERGLILAGKGDSSKDQNEARLLLIHGYYYARHYAEAALLGDMMARSSARDPASAAAGGIAIQSYRATLDELSAINPPVNDAEKAPDIARLKALAVYMEQTFPQAPETNWARFNLAYLARQIDKNNVEATRLYSLLTPTFPRYLITKLNQGSLCLELIKISTENGEAIRDPEVLAQNLATHKALWVATVQQLETLPIPAANASLDQVSAYILARINLGNLYLLSPADREKPLALVDDITKTMATFTQLAGPGKIDLAARVRNLRLSTLSLLAFSDLREGQHAKVAERLDPEIKVIEAEAGKPIEGEVPQSQQIQAKLGRELIVMAMRSSVESGQIDRARGLLDTLQKLDKNPEQFQAIMSSMVTTIRHQLDEYRKDKKEEEAKKLTKDFSTFLDQIAAREGNTTGTWLFLARAYAGIDDFTKAAELLEKVHKTALTPLKEGDAEATKKHETELHSIQLMLARTYRQAGKLKEAETLFKTEILGDPAKKEIDPMTKQPKKYWGSSFLPARREYILLLEDQKKFREAVAAWTALAKSFGDKLPALPVKNADEQHARKMYFELYIESQRASARAYSGISAKAPANVLQQQEDGFGNVAKKLVDLEKLAPDLNDDHRDSIRSLLELYPQVKAKYIEAGGTLIKPTKPVKK